MTQVIREGVFETNSSSSHSISIDHSDFTLSKMPFKAIPENDEGIIEIYPGEFGWEVESYHDAPSKASYCLTFIKGMDKRDRKVYGDEKPWVETESDNNNQYLKHERMLKKAILEVTKAKDVSFVAREDGYYPWGYIDHQSDSVAAEAFESEENLKAFIFNPKSILHTDNDNH